MLPTITIEGRAVADPELRFTGSGKAVATIRVAASERKKNDRGEWEDGDRLFLNASIWEDAAEQVAETITQGDRIIVTGRLYQREYEGRDGGKRTSLEVKFATVAKVVAAKMAERTSAPSTSSASTTDPWATTAPAGDEPPF